jgi:hypothetical protein
MAGLAVLRRRERGAGEGIIVAIALAVLTLRPIAADAHETDQYTLPLGREFADLRIHFTRVVHGAIVTAVNATNAAIKESLWNNEPTAETPPLQSADYIAGQVWGKLFAAIPTNELLDAALAGDAMRSRYPGLVVAYRPEQNIYDDPLLLVDVTKMVRTFFRSSTVNVGGTLFGTDKFLHFIHVGRIYHSTYLGAREEGLTETAAVARAVQGSAGYNPLLSENGLLGMVTTGIRSNGDLAADYAGLKFYRNLTEPVRIGKALLPPMLVREGPYWRLDGRVQAGSNFFAAFITPHFNEALNPNTYLPLIDARVRAMLRSRCFDLVDWYRDERGRVRNRQQFAAVAEDLSTFYGEPYGHQNDGENTVSIATTCFEAGAPGDTGGPSSPAVSQALLRVAAPSSRPQWADGDRFGRTELWWAARDGRIDAVERLLAEVENPNALDLDGEGPLHAAARGGHAAVVEILIAHGADPRAKALYGSTPLHAAVEQSHLDAARALLKNGADVNARDEFGGTPLHQAALQGNRELAKLLLDTGADPAAVYAARTPVQLAARAGNEAMAKWLDSYRPSAVAKSGGGALPGDETRPRDYVPPLQMPAKPGPRKPGSPVD